MLREFERQFTQLSESELIKLALKRKLFVQAADFQLQKMIKPLFKEAMRNKKLKINQKELEKLVLLLTKKQ